MLVAGSLADGMATQMSDLDLLVLLDDPKALKKPPREIYAVRYVACDHCGGRFVDGMT